MGKIERVLVGNKGERFYVSDVTKDLHTQFGMIKKKELKKKGKVKTNKGKEFFIYPAGFVDRFKKIKRGAQIITLKDAGAIIANTGVNKNSKAVDIGGGSGALSCVLGNVVKNVVTYEINKSFVKIINENIKNFGLSNVKVKNKDAFKGISEKNIDLMTVDLPEPDKIILYASKSLKNGGFLVCYLPSMTQVINIVEKIGKRSDFIVYKVSETIERDWKVEGRIARPDFRMLGHTGFLVFARKV